MEKVSDKRIAILKSAVDIISKKGFDSVTVSEIVKDAGVAQGTFYLYFPSKKALIPAISDIYISEIFKGITSKVKNNESINKIVEVMIDETFDVTEKYRDLITICYSLIAVVDKKQWDEIYVDYSNWIRDALKNSMEKGEISKDTDIIITTEMLLDLIEGGAENIFVFSDDMKIDGYKERFKSQLLRFIMNALKV